ncbi:tellurium resistance protein TerA [Cohnella sp. CIP 111063]|uniref:TerD family protein n=1 Tax=unclassified Cohnella TaxID=2636738 RepID=UPI000B8BE076|nr:MULTISPECIES: TerD family protein [unclassified Cohnella]OXS59165.1 tellurium resistance protein TerA [Cohnella sp. CIP 111063]PRX72172.1 tellurite resistance protein TerA [Cohnella sp. SGD-V74]
MSLKIIKGQKADVTKNTPISRVVVGMGWGASAGVELDFSVFVLQASGKVRSDQDLIFYSNPNGAGGSIRILGQDKKSYGAQTDQEQVSIDLRSVPQELERIPFTLTIYEGDARRQNFSLVKDAYLRIIDEATGNELLRYELGNQFPVETAIVVGELYRYNGEWKFNAVGSGYSGGLAALCGSFGIVVREEPPAAPPPTPKPEAAKPPVGQASPSPSVPPVPPAPSSPPPAAPPVRLDKIELKKKGDVINLEKKAGTLGEILVNLNWNRKKSGGGFFKAAAGIDLDLGCLFELKDGTKGGVQALGNAFGDFQRPPYVALDGDDRTGALEGGENLRINGAKVSEIERIVIFAFIYSGVTNWSQADGVVTVKYPGGPDIIVRMDEYNNSKGLCAIAMIRNVNNQTFSVERLVQFFDDQQKLDVAYNWGLRWTRGSK